MAGFKKSLYWFVICSFNKIFVHRVTEYEDWVRRTVNSWRFQSFKCPLFVICLQTLRGHIFPHFYSLTHIFICTVSQLVLYPCMMYFLVFMIVAYIQEKIKTDREKKCKFPYFWEVYDWVFSPFLCTFKQKISF